MNAVAAGINLNAPGGYFHWGILTISEANLGVIIGMLVIFLVALLAPFPRGRRHPVVEQPEETQPAVYPTPDTWTGRVRRVAVKWLPPHKLLPERQPSYVGSWIYVFGVATLAALAVAIGSGFAIALGGPDWWHTNPVGHFFNSLHLWSVELFFAFMVIHLWGKFFMAAWRGKRARTWITGMLAFLASILEAFTGYLTQQNFDSQWISTNGKDAFNAAGVGAFFNPMNFGQMLLWHVVLMPLILVAVVGVHVLLVRHRGVVHPFPPRRGRDSLGNRIGTPVRVSAREQRRLDAKDWHGPTRHYDIVREGVAAIAVVLAATFALAGVLSSPDEPSITIQKWAQASPADFLVTSANELAGTSETATYGPPYTVAAAMVQRLGVSWQTLAGVRQRIDPAKTFVLQPLSAVSSTSPALTQALAAYESAPPAQQQKWDNAYGNAAAKATFPSGQPVVPAGDYGPVPVLLTAEYNLARAGGLDASLVSKTPFYGTDFTRPLLFMEDGAYFADRAQAEHLQGDQWGVMNETGSYPGQPWLWMYQFWYHVPGFDNSANVDLIAIYLTGAATLLLVLIPFIPGLRRIPQLIPVHRLIWRSYYREAEQESAAGTGGPTTSDLRTASPR